MTKTLRTPLIRMTVIMTTLLILMVWQFDFIITAASSNFLLNMTIFAVFLFGAVLTYRNVLLLRNEEFAFKAMKEQYADAKAEQNDNITDPLWRHYRCKELAIVFKKPEVLGPAYHLITEQLHKNKRITLTPSTMQTLLDAIDARLFDRKSLTQYVAGILVLLGLIGTFLGLMITLASVGEILAAIDLTGNDPSAAIQNLMKKLQIPLKGMAVGFSSSLFGLVTSLSLGLMVRFSGMGFSEFVRDIEGWLSTIADLEPGGEIATAATGEQQGAMIEEKRLSLIMRTARLSVQSNARINDKLGKLTDAIEALSNDARTQRLALDDLIGSSRQLQSQGHQLNSTMARTVDTVRIIATNNDLKNEMIETTKALSKHLEIRDDHMGNHLKALDMQLTKFNSEEAVQPPADVKQEHDDAYALLEEIKSDLTENSVDTAENTSPQSDVSSDTNTMKG